ncbi:hypothetical protein IKT18_03455 [Candidatus Saccharibacteria bacterium]|nr:hypothetical protein [Candidatus Saccharibacteria bacterium]
MKNSNDKKPKDYDKPFLEAEKLLKLHAKGLGIPTGAAEDFIKRSVKSAQKTLKGKSIITDADLTRAISKELKKYNKDLAYVYENCDIII